jgi:hypothetical protein
VNSREGSRDDARARPPSDGSDAASPQPDEPADELSGELSDETMDSIVGGLSTPVLPLGLRVDPYGR